MTKRMTKRVSEAPVRVLPPDEEAFIYGMGFVSAVFELKREMTMLRRGAKVLQRAALEKRGLTAEELARLSAFMSRRVRGLERDFREAEARWLKLNGKFYADPAETRWLTDRHERRRRAAAPSPLRKAA